MNKKKFSIYFAFISFFTAFIIFTSIVQKSYFNLINKEQDPDVTNLIKEINPSLDTSIIQEIKDRPDSIDSGSINFIQEESEEKDLSVSKTNEATQTSKTNQTNQDD